LQDSVILYRRCNHTVENRQNVRCRRILGFRISSRASRLLCTALAIGHPCVQTASNNVRAVYCMCVFLVGSIQL